METKKTCVVCGEMKPLDLFSLRKENRDGRRGECKSCNSRRVADRARALRAAGDPRAERVRERQRSASGRAWANAFFKRPEQKERRARQMRKYRRTEAGKIKEKARAAVRSALEEGVLIRPKCCQDCGKDPGIGTHGRSLLRADHHRGYAEAYWLEVQWVCPSCDGLRERMRRQIPELTSTSAG